MSQTLYSDMGLAACEQLARAWSQSATADGAWAPTPLFHLLFFSPLHIGHKKVSKSHRKKEKKKAFRPPRTEEVLDCLQCNWRQVAAPGILRSRRLITGNIWRSGRSWVTSRVVWMARTRSHVEVERCEVSEVASRLTLWRAHLAPGHSHKMYEKWLGSD